MALPDRFEELPLGELIALSAALRDEASNLSKQEAELRAEKELVDTEILNLMEALGTDSTSANGFTVTRKKDDIATVTDWSELYDFIVANNAPYMLQRRVTQDAVKDMVAQHGTVPGVELMPKVSLSLRKK